MFGKLVGHGQAGFVFENPNNSNTYYKMVALPNKPLREYGLNSTQAKLFAINQNQAELFFRLYQENLDIPQLPKVSKFLLGEVTTPLRRNLLQTTDGEELQHLLSSLRTGQKIAVWEMEKIPCLTQNDFCQMFPNLSPQQNPDYQNLLSTMLDLGFVVRDVANPENFGFRENGTQVFYDPIVAPWPVTEADELDNPRKYETFVSAFGKDQIPTTSRSIRNGDYFTWYHGGGIMEAEETLFEYKMKKFPTQVGAINWYGEWSAEDYYKRWLHYWNNVADIISEEHGNNEDFDADLVMDWWYEITPDNMAEATLNIMKQGFMKDDLDLIQETQDYLTAENPISIEFWRKSAAPVEGLLARRDRSFKRWLGSYPISVDCAECDEGIVTITMGEYDEHEYTETCELCHGDGSYSPDNSDNKWYRQNKERLT